MGLPLVGVKGCHDGNRTQYSSEETIDSAVQDSVVIGGSLVEQSLAVQPSLATQFAFKGAKFLYVK